MSFLHDWMITQRKWLEKGLNPARLCKNSLPPCMSSTHSDSRWWKKLSKHNHAFRSGHIYNITERVNLTRIMGHIIKPIVQTWYRKCTERGTHIRRYERRDIEQKMGVSFGSTRAILKEGFQINRTCVRQSCQHKYWRRMVPISVRRLSSQVQA